MNDPSVRAPRATAPTQRREWWFLGSVLVAGLALRGLYLTEITATPEFSQPAVDAEFHHYWARALATGDWTPPHGQPDPNLRTTPFLRPPGYPYFLAIVFRIAGPGFLASRLVQFALGLLNCWLIYRLARRWQGPGVGLLCAAMMTVDWVFIYFESRFLEPVVLITFLLSAALLLGRWMQSGAARHALTAGVLLGLAATVRPNALLLIPVAAVWMIGWAEKDSRKKGAVIGAVTMALGGLIPVAPVTLRNAVVAKDWVLISSNAGVNLFIGNNERSDGLFTGGLEGLGDFGTCYDFPRLVRNLERQLGRPLKHSEVSRYFTRRALAFLVEHPGDLVKLTVRKALQFWAPYEISHNSVVAYDRQFSNVLRRLPFGFSFVSGTFLLGVLTYGFQAKKRRLGKPSDSIAREQDRYVVLLLAFPLAYFFSFLPFFNASLYRVPIIPFLILFGGYGLWHLWRCLHGRDYRSVCVWGLVWIVSWIAGNVSWIPFQPDLGEWYFNRGVAYDRNGDSPRALEHLVEAKRLRPADVHTRCGLANALLYAGRPDDAVAEWKQALDLDPSNIKVHHDLGNALLRLGRNDDAMNVYAKAVQLGSDFAAPYFNLANLLAARGDFHRAIPLFESGLHIEPDAPQGHLGLGLALARTGKLDDGIHHCRQAVYLHPDSAEAHLNLGVLLQEQGRTQEAIEHYSEVLRLAPRHAHACHNLGVALQGLGRNEEAASYYEKALNLDPRLALSRRNLGQVLLLLSRPADAEPHLNKACTLLPQDAASFRDHGIALVQLNRTDEGIQRMKQAVALDAADVAARMALAAAYQSAGKPAAAADQYRAVLALDPNHAEAKRQLEALVGL